MEASKPTYPDALAATIALLEQETERIVPARKARLAEIAGHVAYCAKAGDLPGIVFVCTHNSRRSQLAEAWFRAAVHHYRLAGPEAYSAGTEATAFFPAMVAAMRRFGFQLQRAGPQVNPEYVLQFTGIEPENRPLFSKALTHPANPSADFIAVMVCSEADAACPFVPGASGRFSLPYTDPKIADGTADEQRIYDQKVLEIGREMLYLARCLNDTV